MMGIIKRTLGLAVVGATVLALGCGGPITVGTVGDDSGNDDGPDISNPGFPDGGLVDWGVETRPAHEVDYIEHLDRGATQRQNLCSQGLNGRLTDWYCADQAPEINGLEDVLVGLGLKDANGQLSNTTLFAISGHSSSLVTRRTTVLNPRAIIFTEQGTPDYAALGYIRGDGFAEVAAFDPVKQDVNFFLVSFKRGCEPDCSNAERFLPRNETGWQDVAIYSDQDLKNTVFDCLQCHEPQGKDTGRILRMQELVDPWTHWFRDNRGTRALLDQFQAAHPNEDYAGIPANQISNSNPADLEDLVRDAGFGNQPNLFEGDNINNDDINTMAPNDVWMGLYTNAVEGTMIAPPFFGISPYDDTKVQDYGEMYRQVAAGELADNQMPDVTKVFRADAMRYLSFKPAEGLDARQIVQHRCGTCHDGRFPGISRDNFRIQDFPDNLTPVMKSRISQRIGLSDHSRLRMPPLVFSELSSAEIEKIRNAMK